MLTLTTAEVFETRLLLLSICAAVGDSQKERDPPPKEKVRLAAHEILDIMKQAEERKETA